GNRPYLLWILIFASLYLANGFPTNEAQQRQHRLHQQLQHQPLQQLLLHQRRLHQQPQHQPLQQQPNRRHQHQQ
ncbi:unnamed protein product, partial [Rotaria sordida]